VAFSRIRGDRDVGATSGSAAACVTQPNRGRPPSTAIAGPGRPLRTKTLMGPRKPRKSFRRSAQAPLGRRRSACYDPSVAADRRPVHQTKGESNVYQSVCRARLRPRPGAIHLRAPALGPHDVEIAVTHCGICHSDVHMIDNDWKISRYPLVPGHEVVGTVTAMDRRSRT